jgi:hypothetical protein
MLFTLAAFVAGGWLALRSSTVAEFVNKAAVEFFQLLATLKEALF